MSKAFDRVVKELHNLPNKITELRLSKNLSKKQLAEDLGVSSSLISSYENGTRLPSLDMLIRISYYFNVSSDYILGIDNEDLMKRPNYDDLSPTQMKAIEAVITAFKSDS